MKKDFGFSIVVEFDAIVKEYRQKTEEVHMARVHGICVEKNHQVPKEDPRRKFKGRGVNSIPATIPEEAEVVHIAEGGGEEELRGHQHRKARRSWRQAQVDWWPKAVTFKGSGKESWRPKSKRKPDEVHHDRQDEWYQSHEEDSYRGYDGKGDRYGGTHRDWWNCRDHDCY